VEPDKERLVLRLVRGPGGREPIANEEFLQQWPATDGVALGLELLRRAVAEESSDDAEFAMVVCWRFGWTAEHLPSLLALADADWHERHEDVVQALGKLRSEQSLTALERLVHVRMPYLEYNDSTALANHALHAVAAIGGPEARHVLDDASSDSREAVAATAARLRNRV
jgi:hypothetical protein